MLLLIPLLAWAALGLVKVYEAMHTLEAHINNATPNVDFAGKQLVKQAEDVVQKSKADIEAYVVATAQRLGVDPAAVRELPAGMDQS